MSPAPCTSLLPPLPGPCTARSPLCPHHSLVSHSPGTASVPLSPLAPAVPPPPATLHHLCHLPCSCFTPLAHCDSSMSPFVPSWAQPTQQERIGVHFNGKWAGSASVLPRLSPPILPAKTWQCQMGKQPGWLSQERASHGKRATELLLDDSQPGRGRAHTERGTQHFMPSTHCLPHAHWESIWEEA